MADFVAVMKKALGGLDNPTVEMREKIYARARMTVSAKLAAISPPPSAAVIERQRAALEKAIADIESEYGENETNTVANEDPLTGFAPGNAFGATPPPAAPVAKRPGRKRGRGGLIAVVIVMLLLAGGAYGVWRNKEDLARMAGLEHLLPGGQDDAAGAGSDSAGRDAGDADAGPEETTDAAGPEETTDAAAPEDAPAANEEEAKFTQRLLEDGTEIDAGPAGGEPSIGEGASVAAANPRENTAEDAPVAETGPGAGEPEQTGDGTPDGTAFPVGQRAIFYEERTADSQGSAEPGAVVWSIVQESRSGGPPAPPAIRAEATIPEKDLQFRMTIRRNADDSLPASHIIEMVFIAPDGFDDGGIENVLRIAFKDSEQSTGNPLLGIPAKISDGFFLLALTDSKADIEANISMMRGLDWLDIPLVYNSGRRALITLEKGVPGAKAFDEVLNAWAKESGG